MHTSKQVTVYQSDAEGHVLIRLAKAPIWVADGLDHPRDQTLTFTSNGAARAICALFWGILRAMFGRFDPSPQISPSEELREAAGLHGLQPVNVSLMLRNLYAKEGIPFNPRMPMVAQRWRIAEELRKDLRRCDEPLKAGLERLVEQLEAGSAATAQCAPEPPQGSDK